MNEYVSKEYIRNVTLNRWGDACGAESYAYSRVLDDIYEAPTADVVEIKHGRWYLADDGDGAVCSECGTDFCALLNEVMRFRYCPNCGAYMRETYGD